MLETVHSEFNPHRLMAWRSMGTGIVAALVNHRADKAHLRRRLRIRPLRPAHAQRRQAEADNNPFQFSTQSYRDRETGLVYYGHRYYDPSLGRFINRDPSEEAGGLNLYTMDLWGTDSINDWDYLGLDSGSDSETGKDNGPTEWTTPDGSHDDSIIQIQVVAQ